MDTFTTMSILCEDQHVSLMERSLAFCRIPISVHVRI